MENLGVPDSGTPSQSSDYKVAVTGTFYFAAASAAFTFSGVAGRLYILTSQALFMTLFRPLFPGRGLCRETLRVFKHPLQDV